MLVEAVSTIATLVAAGYAAHRIEMAMLARKGYDTRDFFKPLRRKPAEPVKMPALWTEEDERRQALAFIADPTCFWLDPNLFGDNPDWREKLERASPQDSEARALILGRTRISGNLIYNDGFYDEPEPEPPVNDAPPCPVCHTGRRTVMAIHGGEATMWDCFDCGAEFTRAGETKASKKRRAKKRSEDYDLDLPGVPTMATNQERRDAAWLKWKRAGKENHGVCPSLECGFPVDKRDGLYYCTNDRCRHSRTGWK